MTTFDYIPARDNGNTEKEATLYALCNVGQQPGQMHMFGQKYENGGYFVVFSRYCDAVNTFTVAYCKELVAEMEAATAEHIARLEITSGRRRAVYFPDENRLAIFDGSGSTWRPVYENNNGVICKDTFALSDSGCSQY